MLPPDRLPALLASAAVAFLVRRDRPVPLAGYFPEPGAPQPRFGFFPAFRAFCAARLEDIIEVCRRRYQMNEVARCTQIVLGIAAAAGGSADPVALVDLGTGAGLRLQLDRYRYRVGTGTYGPAAAGLSLACDVRGPIIPPPAELPRIAARVGSGERLVNLAHMTSRSSGLGRRPESARLDERPGPPQSGPGIHRLRDGGGVLQRAPYHSLMHCLQVQRADNRHPHDPVVHDPPGHRPGAEQALIFPGRIIRTCIRVGRGGQRLPCLSPDSRSQSPNAYHPRQHIAHVPPARPRLPVAGLTSPPPGPSRRTRRPRCVLMGRAGRRSAPLASHSRTDHPSGMARRPSRRHQVGDHIAALRATGSGDVISFRDDLQKLTVE